MDAISQRLAAKGGIDSAIALQRHLKFSWGRLWLGLLLGGFELESRGDRFYGGRIMVGLRSLGNQAH
ncbi:MAG: hypothetical protein ACFCU8_08900 [Thermosynechococcaceae cyanobacterium]